MNKTLTSPKWQLIWKDLKSWAINSLLFIAPIAAEQIIEILLKQDFGSYSQVVSIILGSLLVLVRKWKNRNYYEAN